MGRSEQIAAIAAIMEGVDGVENVHQRERFKTDWGKFLDLYKNSEGKINGYTISRKVKARQSETLGEFMELSVYVIRGYYGLQDEEDSEGVFQDQLDAIDAALLADETLTDTCDTTHPDTGPMAGAVGLQQDVFELRKFGTVLCHYFEGRICAVELVAN